ncbi:MAG: hypothetical protein A3H93_03305 [Rhodocyclales bacterium RIFCSPLOWO2_02_FULL_63_24]|nr:MAG: hypothetical protein A3H93_03305 [Rhodocyclales bacterium RIFCSPLOWO2_02_FULL_63_24]
MAKFPLLAGQIILKNSSPDSDRFVASPSQRDLEAIMNNASVGIVFTQTRKILRYNPKFAEMFGTSIDGLVGLPGRVVYQSDEDYEALSCAASPFLSNGKPFRTETIMRRQDGSIFWADLISYLVDPADPPQGTIWIIIDISARRASEEAQRRTLLEINTILDNAWVGILYTQNRVFQRCNASGAEMFGYTPEELVGLPGVILYPDQTSYEELGRLASPLLAAGHAYKTERQFKRKDGSLVWCRTAAQAVDPEHTDRGTVWIFENIEEKRQAQEKLDAAYAEQQLILDHSVVGVAFIRDRVVQRCNRRFAEIYGYSAEELGALTTRETYLSASAWEETGELAYPAMARGETYSAELIQQRRNGEPFWVRITGKAIDPARPHDGSIWNMEDITVRKLAEEALRRSRNDLEIRVEERTSELAGANRKIEAEVIERRRAERRLRHLAHHDSLTDLPNRNLLHNRIEEAISDARSTGRGFAVMFLDLDRFKTINDSLGHHVGDMLLRKVATLVTRALCDSDTVARIGGDEFVVLVREIGEVEPLLQRLHLAFRDPIRVAALELYVTSSIGIAFYPHDGDTADRLMRNADTAMYRAKAGGRNAVRVFSPDMKEAAEQYFQIESSLRRGIGRNELVLYYQPIVDCANGVLSHMEALVRWQHPTLGLLGPAEFIPIAEESGLIGSLGDWVLVAACRQIADWRATGLWTVPVAVNLSGYQFNDAGLTKRVESILAETGLAPSSLELEITESVAMHDVERTLGTLHALHDLGITLSVDDFGTGYSSLAYLKRFPVSRLKIDRAFVKNAPTNANDQSIVKAILSLARSLSLEVVAEGIETHAHQDLLRSIGCDLVQGFLISRPLPADQLAEQWLAHNTLPDPMKKTAVRGCRVRCGLAGYLVKDR